MLAKEEEEARERCLAEIDFVRSAYGEDEAWVVEKTIFRRLECSSYGNCINVLLSLTMPEGYPSGDAILVIDARISSDGVVGAHSSCTILRKTVMDALPSLIEACRLSALEHVGSESIFAVLSRADEWISTEFLNIVDSASQINTDDAGEDEKITSKHKNGLVLGRRLIHSHHIIAQSKRKAIVELANKYNLGGYSKIGWPGIIVIEGDERDCISYVDEVRSMRWQHLVVRGEEQVPVIDQEELERARVLPKAMQEAGDKMSYIAELCKRAGLEDLFLTSMKIYSKKESAESQKEPN